MKPELNLLSEAPQPTVSNLSLTLKNQTPKVESIEVDPILGNNCSENWHPDPNKKTRPPLEKNLPPPI